MQNPKSLDEAFAQVCEEMKQIFIRKHRDYGKGNILDTGELGIAFRESDKLNRLKNLLSCGNKPENETIDENWLDIGVYAVIAMLLRRGLFEKLNLKKK